MAATSSLKERKRVRRRRRFDVVGEEIITLSSSFFVAKDNFIIGNKNGLRIISLNRAFVAGFLKKVEKPVAGIRRVLRLRLRTKMTDLDLIRSVSRVETTLSFLFCLMKRQIEGQQGGVLDISGHNNIFYVSDCFGELVPIGVYWDWLGEGWCVGALELSDEEGEWNEGDSFVFIEE